MKDSSCEKVTVAATAVAHLELVLTAPRLGALDRVLEVITKLSVGSSFMHFTKEVTTQMLNS